MQLKPAFVMVGERLNSLNHIGDAVVIKVSIDLSQSYGSASCKKEVIVDSFGFFFFFQIAFISKAFINSPKVSIDILLFEILFSLFCLCLLFTTQ